MHLRVQSLQSLPKNPVLLYKQQHTQSNSIQLRKEDFMLVLMTKEQAIEFKHYAPDVICIDSTHGTINTIKNLRLSKKSHQTRK